MTIAQVNKYLNDHEITNFTDYTLLADNSDIARWSYSIPQPTEQDLPSLEEANAWVLQQFQLNKSYLLKMIENLYIDFLTNKWTPCLRTKELIASDYTITVANTNEMQNIVYLIQLRTLDFEQYNVMASEFDRLKQQIIDRGGIMEYVQYHNL